jgi:hypothetical protein
MQLGRPLFLSLHNKISLESKTPSPSNIVKCEIAE